MSSNCYSISIIDLIKPPLSYGKLVHIINCILLLFHPGLGFALLTKNWFLYAWWKRILMGLYHHTEHTLLIFTSTIPRIGVETFYEDLGSSNITIVVLVKDIYNFNRFNGMLNVFHSKCDHISIKIFHICRVF